MAAFRRSFGHVKLFEVGQAAPVEQEAWAIIFTGSNDPSIRVVNPGSGANGYPPKRSVGTNALRTGTCFALRWH